MSDDIAGWEVVSEHVNRHSFWEIVIGLFAGLRPPPTITYTVRLKSTGATRTITCFGAGELPERIAKGQFDYELIIPDDDAERVLAGFRAGGETGKIALDHIELVFRRRLQKGDIDPKDLFTSLQGFAQRGGDHFVRQFSKRCFPLLSKETQAEIRGLEKFNRRRERRQWRDRIGRAFVADAHGPTTLKFSMMTRHGIFAAFSHPASALFCAGSNPAVAAE